MISLRTGLFTAAALVLGSGLTIAATQGSGNAAQSAPAAPPTSDIATMHPQSVNLPPGAWTSTTLAVHLPQAGTYVIDADVRGRIAGNPSLNTYILARLWDVNSGTPVLYSTRLVYQVIDNNAASGSVGGNNTAPISEWVRVNRPTTILLEAQDNNAVGAASIAQIYSYTDGYTTLRWVRVS